MAKKTVPAVTVDLSAEEVRTLADLAHFYDGSLRPVRTFVRLTSGAEVRRRFRFVAEESNWLERFATMAHEEMLAEGRSSAGIRLTSRSLIAFWGRLLASLNTPRTRRKLSEEEVQRREDLAGKLENAAQSLLRGHRAALEQDVETRRPIEIGWMRERLGIVD